MADDEAAIRALFAATGAAFAKRDFSRAGAFYAADAVLMLPGVPALRGLAAIEDALRAAFGASDVSVEVRVESVTVAVSRELAYALGTGLAQRNGQDSRSKWVAVLARRAEGWRVVADIHNGDDPAAAIVSA